MPKKTSAAMNVLDENKKHIVRHHARGLTMSEIARHYNVSPPSVQKWLKKEGFLYGKKGRYNEKMPENARKLYRRGFSREQIAHCFRCPVAAVSEWTKGEVQKNPRKKKKLKSTYPPRAHRARRRWTPDEKEFVLSMINDGVSPRFIYLRTRASKARQRKIWREAGGSGRPPNFPRPRRFPVRGSAMGVIGYRPALPEVPPPSRRPRFLLQEEDASQRRAGEAVVRIPPDRTELIPIPPTPRPPGLPAGPGSGLAARGPGQPDYGGSPQRRAIEAPLPRVTQISPPQKDGGD